MFMENIRNIAIGIGIMILLPLITQVGARLIMKEPAYPHTSHYAQAEMTQEERQQNVLKHEQEMEQYQLALKEFEKYYFYITTVVGIIALIAGTFIQIPFLGMGFILGGVLCIVFGYLSYWQELNHWIKFASLLMALLLLILASFRFARVSAK